MAKFQLRPFNAGEFVDNGDGTRSTERSRTVQIDGEWVNVPSLWMGDAGPVDLGDMNDDMLAKVASRYEGEAGKRFKRFADLKRPRVRRLRGRPKAGRGRQKAGLKWKPPTLSADFSSRVLTSYRGGTLKRGTKSITARALQLYLRSEGYDIKADGKPGPETEKALKAWQAKEGIQADGRAGGGTFKRIREKITPAPRIRPAPKPALDTTVERNIPMADFNAGPTTPPPPAQSGFDALMAGAPTVPPPGQVASGLTTPVADERTPYDNPAFADTLRRWKEDNPPELGPPPPELNQMARALAGGPGGAPPAHYGPVGQVLQNAGLPVRQAMDVTTANSPLAAGLEAAPDEIQPGMVPANPMRDAGMNPGESPAFQAQPDPGENAALDALRNALLARLPTARRMVAGR